MRDVICVVDGHVPACRHAEQVLWSLGFQVYSCSPSLAVLDFEKKRPSLVVFPLSSSRTNAQAMYDQLRLTASGAKSATLVLLDEEADEREIQLLNGDGWIKAPFHKDELADKVRSLMMRTDHSRTHSSSQPELSIDTWAMKVLVYGVEVPMTTLEFRLIVYLARHRGQVFTRDLLLDAVWGDMQFITPRSVDACILRIRQKIETDRTKPALLKTVRGVGYRLDAVTEWQTPTSEACGCIACTTRSISPDRRFGSKTTRRPAADRVADSANLA